jgi:hypothetical protein
MKKFKAVKAEGLYGIKHIPVRARPMHHLQYPPIIFYDPKDSL